LGESLGLKGEYCNQLEKAARIYDIGNIMICSDVYKKDEKLTFEEFEIVKYHTQTGYNILIEQKFSTMDMAAVISAEHHEWWNGGGYPCCLKGKKEIDIAARIVAVADTVGALFTERPGRKAWNYDKIIEYIKRRDGIQFDPSVVEIFLLNQKVIYEVLHV
jgi:response regulator RpfG family c-di-GMP phosphodiesterase